MVARLKLKEIDGRAPPGVKHIAALCSLQQPGKGWWCLNIVLAVRKTVTPAACREILMRLLLSRQSKDPGGQTRPGYRNMEAMLQWTACSHAPKSI